MKKYFVLAVLSFFILSSCSDNKNNDLQKIKDIQKNLTDKTGPYSIAKANELIDLYVKFAESYPKDTNSITFLFDAANLSINIKPKYAVELFDKIIKEYPDDKRVPDCMFYKAFVYDEKLRDTKRAREGYQSYLKKYPDHTWAKDIPGLLEMLGKTSEQIGVSWSQSKNKIACRKNKIKKPAMKIAGFFILKVIYFLMASPIISPLVLITREYPLSSIFASPFLNESA
jgi:tetratricopeptide (TPR) repeat protein